MTGRAPSIHPITKKLAAYIAGAGRRRLPAKVAERAKHHLLDTLAAAVSGTRLLPGEKAVEYAAKFGSKREATVIGSRLKCDAITAALANGMSAHADETDDSHAPSLTHPGCSIVPTAVAMAERHGSDGRALLSAVTLGYEISARFSLSLHPYKFRAVGHSTHSLAPTFGSAAAAASIAGLNPKQVRHALSYAVQQASGVSCYTRDPDHIEKAFDFGGMPARNAVTAVTMVAAGFTGVDDALFGERSFFVANDESARIGVAPEPSLLVEGLGKTFEIMRTNIKRWSVGSPIQAPLDSLHALVRSESIDWRDVEKLTVRVSQLGAETTDNRDMPDICMQQMCAVMLIDGTVTFEASHDVERMKDGNVLALRRRIELVGDERLQMLLPERHGIVELLLKDGRLLTHHTAQVRGTSNNPMDRSEVQDKCMALMTPTLGTKRARRICDGVWNIEEIADIRALMPLFRA